MDIGRAKLHRDKIQNQKIVDGFTKDFEQGLMELWEYARKRKISIKLRILEFPLGDFFGANLVKRFRSDEDQVGLSLIETLIWGNNQTSGYGSFIDRKKIIPNGIELLPKLLKRVKSRTKFLQNYVAIWKKSKIGAT